jgi:hypothetical protein
VSAWLALAVLAGAWALAVVMAYGRLRARWDSRGDFQMRVVLIKMMIGALGVLYALGAMFVWAIEGAT